MGGVGVCLLMAESAEPKSNFMRRRVLGGTVGVVLILALAVLYFVLFREDSTVLVKVTFLRFDQSRSGKATMAVVRLENKSNERICLPSYDNSETICGHLILPGATNTLVLTMPGNAMTPVLLAPFSVSTSCISLPMHGAVGRLAVSGSVMPRSGTGLIGRARLLWWQLRPPAVHDFLAESDQDIQCPRVLPDGTVEPPRLLPAAERQRVIKQPSADALRPRGARS